MAGILDSINNLIANGALGEETLRILTGQQPVPQRSNDSLLMQNATPPALRPQAAPAPMIVQAMQQGQVPNTAGQSYDMPDVAQAIQQSQVDPRTIPSGPDPYAGTSNKAATDYQASKVTDATNNYGWPDALIDAGRGLMIAGSPDPAKASALFADAWANERAGRKPKVTPLADGAFSMVTYPNGKTEIVKNDQIAGYLGDIQQSKFQQALQKVILGGQVQSQVASDKAAIKTSEDARPLLNDTNGMIDRWNQAQEIIKGQGVGAQVQGAFPGIAGFFGGDQVAANKFLEGLTVDETLLNTARTKGAISNQEMNLFKAPIPSVTDDREKVWKPWIEKRLEVLGKLKTFYEGEVARGAAAGGQPTAGQPAPTSASPAASSGAPVKVTNDSEWANLPSGTQYIGPDGKTRTKR